MIQSFEHSILAYHMVDSAFDWGITRVMPAQFDQQIQLILAAGFRIVDPGQCIIAAGNEKLVAITFDDGYESVFRYAFPILSKYHATATVFAITSYIGQYNGWDANIGGLRFKHMNWHQLGELCRAGWHVGSHGASHLDLTAVTAFRLKKELWHSKLLLENRLGCEITYFSYPFGRVNEHVAASVEEAGYVNAFTLHNVHYNNIKPEFCISRKGIYLVESKQSFQRKLFNRTTCYGKIFSRILLRCARGTSIYKGWLKQKRT